MSEIEELLPDPDYVERYHIDMACTTAQAYDAARHLDFSQSKVTRTLFAIRRLHVKELTIEAITSGDSFSIIFQNPPEEYVIGLIGEGFGAIPIATAQEFTAAVPINGLKVAWNFSTEPLNENRTRLWTETRVTCHGKARFLFKPYWFIVRPFSGLIRKEMLRAAASTNNLKID